MAKLDQEVMELPKKKFQFWNLVWLVVFVGGLVVSTIETNTSLSAFLDSFGQFAEIFTQVAQPNWGYTSTAIPYLIETIKVAVLGTVIGSAIAFMYSLLIARNIIKNKYVTDVLRFIMNIIRTLPDLLLGAIFVAVVGIGPVAGILALSIFTFGVVVKLFYEAIETIDPGPSEAVIACGGNKLNMISFAVMPQILPYFISYTLYAFELNVRASTVLGYIGAGGIGLYLKQTLDIFDYAKTGTIIITVFIMVLIINYVSSKAREALMK